MTQAPVTIPLKPGSDAEALARLMDRSPQGAGLDPQELIPLTRGGNGAVRGLARRLLAGATMHQAQLRAAQLLRDACADLDYRVNEILAEAIDRTSRLQQLDALYELHLGAARRQVERGEHALGCASLISAVSTDLRNGALRLNDPAQLRSLIELYERIAQATRPLAGAAAVARGRRRSPAGGRIRLAHVVCQLVDGGHAPTRSIRAILRYGDLEKFDHYLVVTDALTPHRLHVNQTFVSEPTSRRAPRTLEELNRELAAPVLLPSAHESAIASAAELHQRMTAAAIDVAFFHGSLATPTDWLLCAWQAAPWQLDCGFGVPLHCPAVDHQFFEFEHSMEKLAFACRERGISYSFSGGGHDARDVETAAPFSHAELGLPDHAVVLGAIGNHLPARMSLDCCRTLAGVLHARPRARLLLVGPGDFSQHRLAFGDELCGGPAPRVRFTGPTREAARMTQSFDIVLNTYPGGGGFVLGDAMAAAKPIVCMKYSDSYLSVAGAEWVGEENLVTPATEAAYAARVIELIDQPQLRRALGQRLRARFESTFDARKWVAMLEDTVWKVIHRPATATPPPGLRPPAAPRP